MTLFPTSSEIDTYREYKKTEFAALMKMKPGHLTELLRGKKHVSASIALSLQKQLEIPAEYRMRIQVYYD